MSQYVFIREERQRPTLAATTAHAPMDIHGPAREPDADEILVYLRLLLTKAAEQSAPITREVLRWHGAKTPLFDGVVDWFDRIDAFVTGARGVRVPREAVQHMDVTVKEAQRLALLAAVAHA